VSWLAGLNPAGTQYRAQISPISDFSLSVVSSETYNLGASFGSLLGNTSYYLRVASLGIGGGVSAYGQTTATSTLTNTPTAAATPFTGAFASSVTVSWTPLPIAPQDQSAEGYRVDASTASDFTGTLFTGITNSPAAVSLTLAGLGQDTTYTFRVGALNWQNIPTYFVVGTTRTSGLISSSGTFNAGAPLTLSVEPSVPEISSVRVNIPVETFAHGTPVSVNATVAPLAPPQTNQGNIELLSNQIGIDITAGGNQPKNPVQITFTYSPGQIPAGVDLDTLVIGRFDNDFPLWTLLPTVHNSGNNTLTAITDHFSVFTPLIVLGANNLDDIQAFPVPWKVGTGDPKYDASFLSFTNLPPSGKLRIYTILGEFIWEGISPSTGILLWDGKNNSGHNVGSGTYIAVVSFAGNTHVERVVVVR